MKLLIKFIFLKEPYFVCSDVGKGRMQWYAMLAQPSGQQTLLVAVKMFY